MSYLNVTERINAQSIEQKAKFPNKNLLANGNEILAGDTVTLLGTAASQLKVRLPASAAIDLKAPPAKDDRFHLRKMIVSIIRLPNALPFSGEPAARTVR